MADGKGCKCFARAEGECGCGVDWRSAREVELEAEVERLKEALKEISEMECGGNIVGCSGCINIATICADNALQDKE